MGNSEDGVAVAEAHESGGGSGGSSEVGASTAFPGGGMDESERCGGGGSGNRWPKQETLALLKLRFDMDAAFRDSNLKGKMAELGFKRNGKKCKEKFENVNKYHKRTKDGRSANPEGKTYPFSDQLQAWENTPVPVFPFCSTTTQLAAATTMTAAPMQTNVSNFMIQSRVSTVPSLSPDPLSIVHPNNSIKSRLQLPLQAINTSNHPQIQPFKFSNFPRESTSLVSNSTSSSTSSDEGMKRQWEKKRKLKDFFECLIKNVVQKQEELHKNFLDTLDKRERDLMAREEAWRNQERERINRGYELLVQERSISAAKDAAVVAFLQKLTEQSNLRIPKSSIAPLLQVEVPAPQITQQSQQTPPPQPQQSTLPSPQVVTMTPTNILNTPKTDVDCCDSIILASSLRWPKAEVEALINLRTSLDLKYPENLPKGVIWEEISASMCQLGYNRSSKRCKQKWENINKYFKKVKDGIKRRREDSKTCPYFDRLDALHKERTKSTDILSINHDYLVKPNNPMVPIMVPPEQQWPVLEQQQQVSTLHDQYKDEEIENIDHEEEEEEDEGVMK